ncbi:redox-sensitive transcriptional activator SoxR [Sporichthya sp.]|uniref:redox-sensitive transcriptional activator SoxR n=1 Tax=Sporichthya sp. TaxID=65475 RepID=UPI0017C2AA78|nr:redox-sensitive transcriptional activator SoxR [Sporichthya sp.]MBA3743919.1 redox-sensitive transcriptional activator SoxR [Sporichthya sp.]
MRAAEELLTIGELAGRSGFATSAVRFYDKEGLVPAERTSGNQRRYPRSALRRLAFIRAAQNIGVPLAEIREALTDLPDTRTPTKADWARLSKHWRARLDAQIAGLEALRDDLDSCIGCGCLSLQRCALYNPGDLVAARGPGARLLPPTVRDHQS